MLIKINRKFQNYFETVPNYTNRVNIFDRWMSTFNKIIDIFCVPNMHFKRGQGRHFHDNGTKIKIFNQV